MTARSPRINEIGAVIDRAYNRLGLFENVEYRFREYLIVRFIPALFKPFLPVLGPRPAVVIDEIRIGWRQLHRPALDILDVAQTLDIRIPAALIIHGSASGEAECRSNRRNESIRIVEYGLVIQSDELAASVICRLPRFDRFHLVAEFEHRVRQGPPLNIR